MEFIMVLLIFIVCVQIYIINEINKDKQELEKELKIKDYESKINDEELKYLVGNKHCINCKNSLYIGFNTLANGEIFCDDLSNNCLKYNRSIKEIQSDNFSLYNPAVYCKYFSIKDKVVYDFLENSNLDKNNSLNNLEELEQKNNILLNKVKELEERNIILLKNIHELEQDNKILTNTIRESTLEKPKCKDPIDDIDKNINNINFDELINKAKELALNNVWNDEAIKVNQQIISLDSSYSAAYTRLAKCYVIKKDYERAEALYKQVLSFDSENVIAQNRLADLLDIKDREIKRQFDEIISCLKEEFKESFIRINYEEDFLMFYNDDYNPYRGGNNKKFRVNEDGSILKLKNNDRKIIEEYSELLVSKLKKISYISDNIVIISIPSSRIGNKNGINIVTENVAKTNKFIDESNNLIRFCNIEKLATGGSRNKTVHINSIKYENDNIDLSKKIVILIDDVITTGNSLLASREILIKSGAKYVLAVGLCKTYFENSNTQYEFEDEYYYKYGMDSNFNDLEDRLEWDIRIR